MLDLLDLDARYRVEPEGRVGRRGCPKASRCTRAAIAAAPTASSRRRGGERSRTPIDLRDEVRDLVQRGTREVVLLSQIAERYGRDLTPRVRWRAAGAARRRDGPAAHPLPDLLPGRLRPDLIEAVATLPKVCEDINLPIQSGDDTSCERMPRGYTVDFYRRLVGRLRERIPEMRLQTDVIVGFPGEIGRQFENTLRLLAEVEFDIVHVAAYSPRPGTPAADWADQLPLDEKKHRLRSVEELQKDIATAKNARCMDEPSRSWSRARLVANGTGERERTSWCTSSRLET